MRTDRIPGFAICAHCGGKKALEGCSTCGLIVCEGCRTGAICLLCVREAELPGLPARPWTARAWRAVARAGFAVPVSLGALAGLGQLLLPPATPSGLVGDAEVAARAALRGVASGVAQFAADHDGRCPRALGQLRQARYLHAPTVDPWGEPLLFSCAEEPGTFVVLSKGPDGIAGTADDLSLSSSWLAAFRE